jgi:hypothetical protein
MLLPLIVVGVLGVFLVLRLWRAVAGWVGGVVGAVAGGLIANAVVPPNKLDFFPGLLQDYVGGAIGFAVGVLAALLAFEPIKRLLDGKSNEGHDPDPDPRPSVRQ